jgi:hypothetical protein
LWLNDDIKYLMDFVSFQAVKTEKGLLLS